jgi:DNA invertase Pin-like site-specific DNA recombinase
MTDEVYKFCVATYDRVSLAWQTEGAAMPDLRAEAGRRGYRVALEIAETMSRDRYDRPGLGRVMAAAERGRIDAVIVRTLDRFGGTTIEVLANIRRLRAAGVRFVAFEQGIDVGPAPELAGDLVLAVLAAVAEFTLRTIRHNTREGLRRTRERGQRLGRPLAPGPDPAEVAVLRDVKRWSWRRIADHLGCAPSMARRRYTLHNEAGKK